MDRLITLTVLLTVFGCADGPTTLPVAQQTSDEGISTVVNSVDLPATPNDLPQEYPEIADVTRMLVRAADLESRGKFEDALAIANQAVAMDPNSPAANGVKARLEELLRRTQDLL